MARLYNELPNGYGPCPVCQGSGRIDAGELVYKNWIAGYDPKTDTLMCSNCGAQYMFGHPLGMVKLDKNQTPCLHKYISRNVGRCLTEYTCTECGDRYQIDSSD
jgi:hypothetical protein